MSPATIVKPDAKASYAERILSVDYVVSDPAILPAIQAAMRGGRLPKPIAQAGGQWPELSENSARCLCGRGPGMIGPHPPY
jgi:hypothetical protein